MADPKYWAEFAANRNSSMAFTDTEIAVGEAYLAMLNELKRIRSAVQSGLRIGHQDLGHINAAINKAGG